MTQQDTQPPAETLAIIEMLQAAEVQEGVTVFDHSAEEIGIAVMENHRAILAALTRRAGGDGTSDIGDTSRCCNCGKPLATATSCIPFGDEGEAACSTGCWDAHEKLGCPFATGHKYRRAGGDAIPAGEVRKVAFYYELGHDIRPGESLPDRDRRIYEQGRHDALNDEPEPFI